MTTEQLAEKYAIEEVGEDADNVNNPSHYHYTRIKQAYLAGANGRWVKVSNRGDMPTRNKKVIAFDREDNFTMAVSHDGEFWNDLVTAKYHEWNFYTRYILPNPPQD